MTFADLQAGDSLFVDANTLVYHFTSHAVFGAACTTSTDLATAPGVQIIGGGRR